MKLIDLLVQELPKHGGWPEGVYHAWCDPDGEIRFRNGNCKPDFYPESEVDIQYRVPNSSHEDDPLYIVTPEQYEAALAAAQQPVWDGEGFPPVGCECEALYNTIDSVWFKVRVLAHDSDRVVGRWVEGHKQGEVFDYSSLKSFRPIRSESDKRRDEAIAALKKLKPQLVGELAGYLYDEIAAGKIPHISIEQAA
ncbi:hypothetical protein ACN5L6_003472 [Cronobacter dublinensis]